MSKKPAGKKEEPIYERLDPNQCLIISKTDTEVLFACNKDGKIEVQRVKIPEASADLSASVTVRKAKKDQS